MKCECGKEITPDQDRESVNTDISDELKVLIQNKGYELRSGRIRFPKNLRDRFRQETSDYYSNDVEIITKMIEVYNE